MRRSAPELRAAPRRPRLRTFGRRLGARLGRRAILLLIVLSSFGGLLTSANPQATSADQLSDAYARQRQLQQLIARQKAQMKSLAANQAALSGKLASTKHNLTAINANLLSVKTQIVSMVVEVAKAQSQVDELNATSGRLDAELAEIVAEEAAKQAELDTRKALLASRIRESYDTDRTSVVDSFLKGEDFTDVLTQVGDHLAFAEQDKALADQIADDQHVLDVLHENVDMARQQTEELHQLAALSKKQLDGQLKQLADSRAELSRLEAETKSLLSAQQAQFAEISKNKAQLAAMLAAAKKAEQQLESLIDRLIAEAIRKGGIPSQYNGTFSWPMAGRITQEFGCTGFWAEPSYGNCAHFHRGIDIATTIYTPIRAAGPGKVIWAGRSPYDTAWIVIIAHSTKLESWYGHVANGSHAPVVRAGQYVAKGQLIAYEGMTGNTTGPHLHWAVRLNGVWVNPRLFLPR